ncbi:MAG TPA: plastocyanin/azurin family copper-binding protein [Gemmatimonadales bacterium]|nr:plastocyanin/azurin family copper-binding protein [Gemmatimonadales bacterium]
MRTAWLALALWAGWEGRRPPAAVEIHTFQFSRPTLEVPVGTVVVWSNRDAVEHTITSGAPDSADGAFAGRLSDSGAVFRHRFDHPGTYHYFCERHHFMRGEIRVVTHTHGES